MKKFAIVLSIAALALVGAASANAQGFSRAAVRAHNGRIGVNVSRNGFRRGDRDDFRRGDRDDFGFGVRIGGRNGGVFIGGGRGYDRDDRYRGYRGPRFYAPYYGNYGYANPGYFYPGYVNPGYVYQPITVTVMEVVYQQVPETYVDCCGHVRYTGRYITVRREVPVTVSAWYDYSYGGYVYRNRSGIICRYRGYIGRR